MLSLLFLYIPLFSLQSHLEDHGLAALQADTVLCHALGPELARMYGGALRSALRRFRSHVTDWEIAEYREMV